ncbi:MAG TPA: SDR family NAD(P)-dependent oxidoreductase [Acidimicrobiales bacterium]
MARYRGTVVSIRSVEETFDYMADFANAAEWDPGTATAERLDDGPVGLGSRFRLGVRIGSRATPLDYRIVTFEPPHTVVLLGESDSIRSEDTMTVTAAADGRSILTYDADLSLKGSFALANPVLPLFFDRIGDQGVAGLRATLGGPPVPRDRPPAGDAVAATVDKLLEATVVASFSSIGPAVRSRTAGWTPPPPMTGRTVLITGATSGLGLATARGVARLGARVVLTARGHDRAERAVASVLEAAPDADVTYLLADMGEFEQVRGLADEFLAAHDRLDVLIHNAGALTNVRTLTGAGTELTVASQVAAPFLLTGLLSAALEAAAPARVIQVSSGGMYAQRFDLATMEMGPDDYDGTVAYARAKRAQLVLMHEWVRRMEGTGVTFLAMHPGWADTPGVRHSLPGFSKVMGPILRTADQGADTVVWLASAPEGIETTGGFWLDRRLRWEHKVPWTRLSEPEFVEAGAELWAWCAGRTGWDGPARSA